MIPCVSVSFQWCLLCVRDSAVLLSRCDDSQAARCCRKRCCSKSLSYFEVQCGLGLHLRKPACDGEYGKRHFPTPKIPPLGPLGARSPGPSERAKSSP